MLAGEAVWNARAALELDESGQPSTSNSGKQVVPDNSRYTHVVESAARYRPPRMPCRSATR